VRHLDGRLDKLIALLDQLSAKEMSDAESLIDKSDGDRMFPLSGMG
jgi:hypothetical protein